MGTKIYPVPLPVLPGQEVPLTVQLEAPPVEGRFISYFRLQNAATSTPFGQRFWADFRVANKPEECAAGCNIPTEQLEELPQAIAEAISSVVSGEDAPHEALGKLLKTWQMVQHEDSVPAAAMPTAAPTPACASTDEVKHTVVDDNNLGSEDDWQSLWGAEVALLAAMGFEPFGDVLPLLQQHLVTPLSMQPVGTDNGAIDADGFQRVINALLAARARDAEAASAAAPGSKTP